MPNWKAKETKPEKTSKCYWAEDVRRPSVYPKSETCKHLPNPEDKPNGKLPPIPLRWKNYAIEHGQLWPLCPACGKITLSAERCFYCGQLFEGEIE